MSPSHTPRFLALLLSACAVFGMCVPTIALGVTRAAVLSRGEVWISKKVPYSQSRYASEGGAIVSSSASGWRTDCSGFASMSFGFTTSSGAPLSLDTASLPYRCDELSSREQLRPGDLILRPKNFVIDGKQVPYGHAVVFVRWTDGTKTTYVGYQQSSSQRGAVMSQIRYPFYSEKGFKPYKMTTIEDVRLRKSLTWFRPIASTAVSAQ